MSKLSELKYVYEADLIFVEVSSGVYLVGKDRNSLYKKGYYVSSREVAQDMNLKSVKVAICTGTIEHFVRANFQLKEEVSNA